MNEVEGAARARKSSRSRNPDSRVIPRRKDNLVDAEELRSESATDHESVVTGFLTTSTVLNRDKGLNGEKDPNGEKGVGGDHNSEGEGYNIAEVGRRSRAARGKTARAKPIPTKVVQAAKTAPITSPIYPKVYELEQHGIGAEFIDPHARQIIRRLSQQGFKAYIVGGGIRDLLLKKQPKDFDIATDATPRRIKGLFSNSRIIGRRFKLIHIFFYPGPKIFEVSTFRDAAAVNVVEGDVVEGDDDKQPLGDNEFGTEETDAFRRDLTINGIFYDPVTETIVDYVGGMIDLADRVVRVIGEPDKRFAEDPVRLLRVVRHAARSGFAIEESTRASLFNNRHLIQESAPVRVFDELRKDLSSGHFLDILRLLFDTGLAEHLFPMVGAHSVAPDGLVYEILQRLDERHRAGEVLPSSLVLSLLALASRAVDHAGVGITPFIAYSELTEYLDTFFSSLAVPRRERERVHDVLVLWTYLLGQAEGLVVEGINGNMLSRGAIDDAKEFLKILPPTKHDRELYRRLIAGNFYEAESEVDGRRRSRRRRGGRRNR